MKKSYKGQSMWSELKWALGDCFKQNKLKIIISACILFIAFLTGVIIAIKYYNASYCLSDYGLVNFNGGLISSSFFSRFFSMLLIMLLLFLCSFTTWTFPLAILILAYRTYLLGLNLTLMFILFGIPGMLVSLIIALPCQLIILSILVIYFVLLYNTNCSSKCYGGKGVWNNRLKISLIILLLLFLCNFGETLLLVIFNVKVILVI